MPASGVVPRADEVVARFFADARRTGAGPTERVQRAEADLRECLESVGARLLSGTELALVALERQFEEHGAVARVVAADAVLAVLPVYLGEYRWQGLDLADRTLRIRLAEPLAHQVLEVPALRGRRLAAAVGRVEATVRHETWMVRQEREVARHG